MGLFPARSGLAERIILETRKQEGVMDEEDEFKTYKEKFGTDLYATMAQVRDEFPETFSQIRQQQFEGYNQLLDVVINLYPKTVDGYWQIFRRTMGKGSLLATPDESLSDEENDQRLYDDLMKLHSCKHEVKTRSSTGPLSQNIAEIEKEMGIKIGEEVPFPIDFTQEPRYRLIATEADEVLGVPLYIMKNGGEPFQTIWDISQKEVPKLQYTEK